MAGRSPRELTAAGSHAFFFEERYPEDQYALWRTDGTAAGTILLHKFQEPYELSYENIVVVGSSLYFPADDGTNGCEKWASDGSGQGTFKIPSSTKQQAEPDGIGRASYCAGRLTFSNGKLYFGDRDALYGDELWAMLTVGREQ